MTFSKIGCVLLILFLAPLVLFEVDPVFAAEPVKVSQFPASPLTLSGVTPIPGNSTMQIKNVVISSQPDRLLIVGITLGLKDARPTDTTVSSVNYGPSGANCPGTQPMLLVSGSNSTVVDQTTNVFFYLTAPATGTCDVIIKLSQNQGKLDAVTVASASASAIFFTGVDQTTPIELPPFTKTAGVVNNAPQVDSTLSITGTTTDRKVVDLISGYVDNGGVGSIVGANQVSIHQTRFNSIAPYISRMGLSIQSGSAGNDPMTWDLQGVGTYQTSAILIRSCDIPISGCTVVPSSDSSTTSGSCDGDCNPPTLGIDKANKRVVSNGFAFNDNFVDTELYFTSYPLVTAYVGEENSISLRIYENSGPQNLAHVGVAFGLGPGESFNESNVVINWDKAYDGTEKITLIDPDNVLENVRVDSEEVDCEDIDAKCTDITIYHTFREPLEFSMISTNIWDQDRNAWQNYFNYGLEIVGDSLNPPKTYHGIHKGKIFSLTEIGKNSSIDENGDIWTFEKGLWNHNYVSPDHLDRQLTNSEKIWAINHVLKDKSLDDVSYAVLLDRNLDYFVMQKDYQILLAENTLEEMCPKCFDDPYDEIDDIFNYELPESTERITSSLDKTMSFELERANDTLEKMLSSTSYLGKIYR